jgi:hypothetical protein
LYEHYYGLCERPFDLSPDPRYLFLSPPRTILVICDNALVSGGAAGERPVRHKTVLDVCHDFDLHQAGPPASPIASPRAPGVASASATPDSSFFPMGYQQ